MIKAHRSIDPGRNVEATRSRAIAGDGPFFEGESRVGLRKEGALEAGEPELSCVLGQPFHHLTMDEALAQCEAAIQQETPRHFVTANLDFVVQMQGSEELRHLLFTADRILCDGKPLLWLSRLCGRGLPERVTGSDLTPLLLGLCARKGYRVYLFGSDSATIERLQNGLGGMFPGLRIAGAVAPPYGAIDSWDNEAYLQMIREARPDVLLVALGFPKQDVWIRRFRERLGVPIAIGIGASLDFLVGKQPRAPRWMQQTGLEWIWRMCSDPRRLTKRYLKDLVWLLHLTGVELACWFQPWRRRRCFAVLGGVRLQARPIRYTGPEDDELVMRAVDDPGARAIILDASEARVAGARLLSALCRFARRAEQVGKPFAVFNLEMRLEKRITGLGMRPLLPCFRSPEALRAWLGWKLSSTPDRGQCSLDCPSHFGLERLSWFKRTVEEVWANAPAAPVQVGLGRLSRLSAWQAMELVRWRLEMRARGRTMVLAEANAAVDDVFKVLGIDDLLGGDRDASTTARVGKEETSASDLGEHGGLVLATEPFWLDEGENAPRFKEWSRTKPFAQEAEKLDS